MDFEINTRKVGKYYNISVNINGVKQDLCLYDKEEIKDVIYQLQDAIDDLINYI